ncbi:MAG: site-2 protease family protein [Acetobacteraceae bacterium]|nr:site-2 protease family protein [Acetobacteraceae bacterium]
MTTETIVRILLAIIPVIIAITFHEVAHGYAALALGDQTARDQGRLSFNPLKHIDRVGTIIVPGFLLISQLLTVGRIVFMFGWAKPVPVSAWKFSNPRRGMAFVAMAGPAMNFVLAWLAALILIWGTAATSNSLIAVALFDFILVNLALGLFNLLPIPPLDGGRVVVGFLPEGLARAWAGIERYGILIVLGALVVLPHAFGVDPIGDVFGYVLPWALRIVVSLAGHDV